MSKRVLKISASSNRTKTCAAIKGEVTCDSAGLCPSPLLTSDLIMDFVMALQVQETRTPTSFDLAGLPKDIMFKIFEMIKGSDDLASMAGLGLACSSFYHILKALHPAPIQIIYQPFSIRHGQCVFLTRYIAEFLGPRYRQSEGQGGKGISGETEHLFSDGILGRGGWKERLDVSSPFGKGEAWYDEVAGILESLDIDSLPEWAAFRWRVTWPVTSVGQRMLDDKMMEALAEWVAMVRL
ncbi:uncharacterized protein PAC_18072 [Phialocephala subalpina]|uniref:F-box domain-containing protein n=1 Tax=Phialocephala subalpina TaxID=576137 RepID=A0A1L7XT06_9HELO|nr:uncharacterized protein PAC_18072 [Phialocephala subalpina]